MKQKHLKRLYLVIFSLVVFLQLLRPAVVRAAPEEEGDSEAVTEILILKENEKALIPRYKEIDGRQYELAESSIDVSVYEYGERFGTEKYDTYEDKYFPDNDLMRVEKTMTKDGVSCTLQGVEYTVTKYLEGTEIPEEYKAHCHYAGVKEYSFVGPVKWVTPLVYRLLPPGEEPDVSVAEDVVEIVIPTVRGPRPVPEPETEAEPETEEEAETEPVTEANEEISEQGIPLTAKENQGLPDWLVPAAAGTAAVILLAAVFWIFGRTVPVYGQNADGRWKKLGRIYVKAGKKELKVTLSETLLRKGETDQYRILFGEAIVSRHQDKVLKINGTQFLLKKEVRFRL